MLDNIVGLGLEIDFANLKSTPHLFLTVRGGGRVEFFSCTVWLGYSSSYWLKFSVLLSCPSLVLWLEREQAIGGNFFLSVLIGVSTLPASPPQPPVQDT